jgi:ubiquinone/menaquinone biosynthesis C-methylase UbiE
MAESFFTDGEAYERLMGRWSRAAGEQFIDWLALPQGLKWLDVGCGTGAFAELVLSRCKPAAIDAIDPAEDQIAYARSRPVAAQTTFRVGDAQALPYDDGTFGVAAMALVFVFVPDPAKAVAEMARVLRPGGTAGAYIWDFLGGGFSQQPLRDAIAATGRPMPPVPRPESCTLDALKAFWDAAKFEQVATRTIEIEVSYPTFDDYWSSQTALPNPVVQALRALSETDVAQLKAGLRERLAGAGGRVAYPAWVNAVKGRAPR